MNPDISFYTFLYHRTVWYKANVTNVTDKREHRNQRSLVGLGETLVEDQRFLLASHSDLGIPGSCGLGFC